jgi:hypothetical protein
MHKVVDVFRVDSGYKNAVAFLNLAKNYDKEIKTYLQEEVVAHRMFGPFCQSEMEDIMKGPFQSSPLIIDAQPQPNGAPDKIRICRHMSKRDKLHPSTNDYVDSSKFPTRFGPISKVGEIVSPLFNFLSPHPKISCYSFFFLLLCTSTPFRHIHLRPFVAYIYALSSRTSTPFHHVHLCFFVAYIYALSSCTSTPLCCMHPRPFIAYIYAFRHVHSCLFVPCIHAFSSPASTLFVVCIHAFSSSRASTHFPSHAFILLSFVICIHVCPHAMPQCLHHLILPAHTHVHKNIEPYLSPPQIATSPPGTQAMTLDITKFHRTCPIHPEHKPWFVLRGPDGFYTDGCCPFGCSSSSSNAGMISNASIDIWQKEGVTPIIKFEDDLNIFRFPIAGGPNSDGTFTPYTYAYDCPQALSHIASLNIPWHPDKGQDFSTSFTYLDFSWDIENKSVTLHDHKCEKFLNRVNNFLASFSGAHCQLLDVMKIHGSLCHIMYIYPDGRNRLPSLSNFICTF